MNDEELYTNDDNFDPVSDNFSDADMLDELLEEITDSDNVDDVTDQETDDSPELADMSAAAEVVPYDYSYIETTNHYLFVIIILFVFFVVTYIFNFLRHSFERLGY